MEKKFELNTYDRVLTRDEDKDIWVAQHFECLEENNNGFIYATIEGFCYKQCIPYNEETKHLHRTSDPYEEPKKGDFVVIGTHELPPYNRFIAIYKGYEECLHGDKDFNRVDVYASFNPRYRSILIDGGGFDCARVVCKATEKEKQVFLNELHEQGYDWDAEKCEVVDYVPPYEPKKGDFIKLVSTDKEEQWICIYKDNGKEMMYVTFADLDRRWGGLNFGSAYSLVGSIISPATEEEKQLLLDALHKEGKDWDAEKMEVVDYKWKPEMRELYFRPRLNESTGSFYPFEDEWREWEVDNISYDNGWIFQTEAECQSLCDKLNEAIKNVR